jgi:hypothetical protein
VEKKNPSSELNAFSFSSGKRSAERDIEAQVVLMTKNERLKKRIHEVNQKKKKL